jgi:hypothetical protein
MSAEMAYDHQLQQDKKWLERYAASTTSSPSAS